MSKITINGESFMTPKDYAKHKKKSLRTVYYLIEAEKIETKRILEKTLVKVS